MKKRLLLFDFDGTITTKDTLLLFLMFYAGKLRFFMGMIILSPVIAAYLLKIIPNWKGKQIVLRYFIGGSPVPEFNSRCADFCRTVLPRYIRPQAAEAVRNAKASGATVAVVSASAENWVSPWCDEYGIQCIATQLEVENNIITGNLCGANCFGPEKVKRIEKAFVLQNFQEIIAFGDSEGDREMFGIAHQHHYKPFRVALAK